jgi:AP-2 complex subunit beta-1/AP-1 complex subunit beta-1
VQVVCSNEGQLDAAAPSVPFYIQMAMKCNLDVFYFQTPCMLSVLMNETGKLTQEEFKQQWMAIPDANEFVHEISSVHATYQGQTMMKERLETNNIFLVAERAFEDKVSMFFATVLVNGVSIM